ncbi:MAG: hypothetical protein Q4C70_12290, partial [Planctomycetia bacterium]|nr:hypothetical protein [Planctomycetia bacterium]
SETEPEEETYELETDDDSGPGVKLDEEEDALRDAEKAESGDGVGNGNDLGTDSETEAEAGKYDADGAYIGDGRSQKRDGKKEESPFLPGKSFVKTEPETLAQWDKELAADRFTRRIVMETSAKVVYYSKNDDFPVVLQGKTDIRDAGGFNADEVRDLNLDCGYILFEGTAYPFGGTEEKPNCVEFPKEDTSVNGENTGEDGVSGVSRNSGLSGDGGNVGVSGAVKKPARKHVLTREKLERPKLPDEPGRRYYVPELAEALGFEAVIVEMTKDSRTYMPILQIKVQRKNADAKKLEEIKSVREQLAEIEKEIVALQSAITACELKKNVRDAEGMEAYQELAELVNRTALLKMPVVSESATDEEIEDARVAREKVYTEKMPSILNVGRERLARRVQEKEELELAIPKSATSWTEQEENTVQCFQGRMYFDAETQKVKKLKMLEAKTPVITAVFSGNFMYDVPLPPDAQKMLDDAKSEKLGKKSGKKSENKTGTASDSEENLDPFGEGAETLSTGLQPFQMSQEEAGARVQLLYDTKDFEVKQTVKTTRKETPEFRVRLMVPRAKSDTSPSPFTTMMVVREIIPGEEKSLDSPPKMVVEGEWMELVPRTETRYFLVSFQIRLNGDGAQNAQDTQSVSIFVTPYYQFKLDGEQESGKNYELTFALTKDFMQQFRPSRERKPTRRRD